MALKQKLAELIVDITAKLSPLKSQLAKANAMLKRGFASMTRMATRAAKYIGVALVAALAWATKAAMVQEDAENDLASALELTGDATQKNIKDFKDYASALQDVTVYGDEFILSLMAQLKILGVSTSRLKEATRTTLGLMTATGRQGQTMIMATAALMAGDTELLTRYIPALRMTTSNVEKMRLAMKLASDGFIVAKDRAKTVRGRLKQLWNTIGDLAEKIGDKLLPGLEKAISWMKQWVDTNAIFVAQKVDEYVGKIAAGLEKIKGPAKVVSNHWGKIWKTGVSFLALGLAVKLFGIGKAAWGVAKAVGGVAKSFGGMISAAVFQQRITDAMMSFSKGMKGLRTPVFIRQILNVFVKMGGAIKGAALGLVGFGKHLVGNRILLGAIAKAWAVVGVQVTLIAAGIASIIYNLGKGVWLLKLWVKEKKNARAVTQKDVEAYKKEHGAAIKLAATKRKARREAEKGAKEELASLKANLDELRAGEKVETATDATRRKALEERAAAAKKEAKRKFNLEIKGLKEWRKTAGVLAQELFDVKAQLAKETLLIDLRNIDKAKQADLQSIEEIKQARLDDLAEKEQEAKEEAKEKRNALIDLYTDAEGFEKELAALRDEQRKEETASLSKQTGLAEEMINKILGSKTQEKAQEKEAPLEIARSGLVGLQAAWGQVATGTQRTQEEQLKALQRIAASTERQEEMAESGVGSPTGTPRY